MEELELTRRLDERVEGAADGDAVVEARHGAVGLVQQLRVVAQLAQLDEDVVERRRAAVGAGAAAEARAGEGGDVLLEEGAVELLLLARQLDRHERLLLGGHLVREDVLLEPPLHVRRDRPLQPAAALRRLGAAAVLCVEGVGVGEDARREEVEEGEELRRAVLHRRAREQRQALVAQAVDDRPRAAVGVLEPLRLVHREERPRHRA